MGCWNGSAGTNCCRCLLQCRAIGRDRTTIATCQVQPWRAVPVRTWAQLRSDNHPFWRLLS